jgi:polysaccharide export outer membrane protein
MYLQNKGNSANIMQVSEVTSKPYRLQINDVLSITIKTDDPKLTAFFNNSNRVDSDANATSLYFSGYTVDDHGNIRFPVLGEISAVGYTTDELRLKIEKQLLDDYFKKEANIFVIVRLGGFKYTINGEVGSVGSKILYQDRVNILEAVANANDINITGDRTAVTVMRQTPTGIEMQDIDLTDINVMKSPYFNLQPNDYIYVKPLKQKSWGTGKTGAESLTALFSVLSVFTTALLLLKL